MRRVSQVVVIVLSVVLLLAWGAYRFRTAETTALALESLAAAPGQFVGSSVGWTHYELAGPDTGRVVVLVHGFSVPSYIWDSTSVALAAAGYRVLRYDLMGRGWSERSDVAYDGDTFDRQLIELLDSLRVTGPVDLMGLSFGGYVTGEFTVRHPERVRTLTWVDPVASSARAAGLMRVPVVARWLFETMAAPTLADGQASDFLHPERFPDWADRYRVQMRYRGFARALHRSRHELQFVEFPTLHAELAATGTPLLLVWGREDRTVPFAYADTVRSRIPHLELVAVDSAGHLPHMEQPAVVRAAMLAFLAAHVGTSAGTAAAMPAGAAAPAAGAR